MAINHTLFTGQTDVAGEIRTRSEDGEKTLPVHSGKKFIRLNPHRKNKKKHSI